MNVHCCGSSQVRTCGTVGNNAAVLYKQEEKGPSSVFFPVVGEMW